MPPWKPEPGVVEFVGERRLSEDKILTIGRWATDGSPEGKRTDLPTPPSSNAGWQLGTPDLVVTLPEYTLRADGADLFRNFVVAPEGEQEVRWPSLPYEAALPSCPRGSRSGGR